MASPLLRAEESVGAENRKPSGRLYPRTRYDATGSVGVNNQGRLYTCLYESSRRIKTNLVRASGPAEAALSRTRWAFGVPCTNFQ